MKKVILISVDGMRPDGLLNCGHPFVEELVARSSHCLEAKTVFPSVTLPCHMSMFHSVSPQRHGILTNTYVPQVRPVSGLFEQLKMAGKKNAFFYGWEELRDIGRPGSVHFGAYRSITAVKGSDRWLTEQALSCIKEQAPDFVFLYLGDTDEIGGHGHGWMSQEYLSCIHTAVDCIQMVLEEADDYSVIITADHGGHERTHGSEMPEDMTIPILLLGEDFAKGAALEDLSILDIAPTIAALMEVYPGGDWEGRNLLKK